MNLIKDIKELLLLFRGAIKELLGIGKYPDPTKHCRAYREKGCIHVDGFLCPCEEMK